MKGPRSAQFQLRPPALWLPSHFVENRSQPLVASPGFMGVAVAYSDVFSRTPRWDDLARALSPYSLERVIDVIGRMSAVLYSADLTWDSEAQLELSRGVFTERLGSAVFETARRISRQNIALGRDPPLLVFHEQQLMDLAKAAFLLKSPDGEPGDDSIDLGGIGEALLIVSDLTAGQPGSVQGAAEGDADYRDRWLQYTLANYLFGRGQLDDQDFGRAFDLYMEPKPQLKGRASYIDRDGVIERITGLSPDVLWSVQFALLGQFTTKSWEDIRQKPLRLDRRTYFRRNFSISAEESDRFLSLSCVDAARFKDAVTQHYSPEALEPHHALPFARWPLVAFGDQVYPVSIRLLAEKLTRGLHHIYLDPQLSADERRKHLDFMGLVFEDYVHRAWERVFPPIVQRYLRLDDMKPRIKEKHCDGLIVYEDAVVLIETKGGLFSVEARSGLDSAAIRQRLKDTYAGAAGQLQSTIALLEKGYRDADHRIPATIRAFYPVVVTLEESPMNSLLYREVLSLLEPGVLAGPATKPLQCMDARDVEKLEVLLGRGQSLRELLEDKLRGERDDSWGNYFYRRRETLPGGRNAYLGGLFHRSGERAEEFFRERAREGGADDRGKGLEGGAT